MDAGLGSEGGGATCVGPSKRLETARFCEIRCVPLGEMILTTDRTPGTMRVSRLGLVWRGQAWLGRARYGWQCQTSGPHSGAASFPRHGKGGRGVRSSPCRVALVIY